MVSDRMAAVIALLAGDGADGARTSRAAAAAMGVDGIGAGVGTGPEGTALAWGRGQTSAALEEVEFTLGEGPGADCVAAGLPVLVADLPGAVSRWPVFTPAAVDLGVRAVFALPLRIGAISVGSLLAYRHTVGPLREGQLVDAVALADTLTALLLRRATDEASRSIVEGGKPERGRAVPETHRLEVHQATGMISVQLGVSLAEALVRLRAHAFAADRSMNEVAADVVARRLRLGDPV